MTGIISFLFVIGTAILIHELGHFIVAGKFGILRHEFSIGMGPAIWKKRKGETVYAIRVIPLGGYVMMAGEDVEKEIVKVDQSIGIKLDSQGLVERIYINPEINTELKIGIVKSNDLYRELTITLQFEDQTTMTYQVKENAMYEDLKTKAVQQIAPYNRCMESKSKFARFATLVAGALMNFLLAFIFLFIVGLRGEPMNTTEISTISQGMPADLAGLEVGDRIVEYNGISVATGDELITAIRETVEESEIVFIRNEETHRVLVTPDVLEAEGEIIPRIGIEQLVAEYQFSLSYAIRYVVTQFGLFFSMMFLTIQMLVGGQAGVSDLAGPIGIAGMATQVAAQGILPLLIFASLININLGVLNLLPLPALDGGRIVFIVLEAIMGRPINRKIEGYVHAAGMLMFLALFVFIAYHDVFRIVG